jgi:hypothetical protein
MTCSEFDEVVLEAARGTLDTVSEAAARRHAAGCPPCAARLRRQEALTGALRALAASARDDAPADRIGEQLMHAFARRPHRRGWRMGRWAAAAVVVLATGTAAGWVTLGRWGSAVPVTAALPVVRPAVLPQTAAPGRARAEAAAAAPAPAQTATAGPRRRPSRENRDSVIQFVAWPGASALPAFESGQLVRTELPGSVVPLLGLGTSGEGRDRVTAEVIVAQDGLPRAVRLVR